MTLTIRTTTTTGGKEVAIVYAGHRPVATLHFSPRASIELDAFLLALKALLQCDGVPPKHSQVRGW